MKVLNAYAGIGGNRHLWPAEWIVTAVELDERIASEYARRYPGDTVRVADAHAIVLERAEEFDAVWSSPPCPTHSRLAKVNASRWGKELEPDPRLMAEIAHLRGIGVPYVVENVHTYYRPPILPDVVTDRHYYWTSNPPHLLSSIERVTLGTWEVRATADELAYAYGLPPLERGSVSDRKRAMRNAVVPLEALEIARAAFELVPASHRVCPEGEHLG